MPVPGAISLQSITPDNPFVIEPLTTSEELTLRFPLPTDNDDQTVFYKMVVETDGGAELDTTEETETVSEEDMQLSADQPAIDFTGTLGAVRRTATISPSSVSDNSAIKNVTYEVSNTTWSTTEIIEESLWRWNWATYDTIANGSYTMKMTVYDYAGLSDYVDNIPFTIDNDYISPVISNVEGSSVKNGIGIAEVGESYAIEANITDSGSAVSQVKEAFINYKINDTNIITYSVATLTKGAGNTWIGNIPAQDITSEALAKNITYYITAEDDDSNDDITGDIFADVNDSTLPDITSHIPVTDVIDTPEGPIITLSATVEDKDTVDLVTLVWREGNDTGLLRPDVWIVANYIDKTDNTWTFAIPAINVTVEGLDYYINASDPSGNTNDGTASSPYHITVDDQTDPTVAFDPEISSPTAPNQDVTVRVEVNDNDPSFSTQRWISETGTVELSIKIGAGSFTFPPWDMIHFSGDSSKFEDGIWELTVDAGNFSAQSIVTIRVEARDQDGQSTTIQTIVDVASAGTPIFRYVPDTVVVSGTSSHILSFDLKNDAYDVSASAAINNITVTLYDNTKGSYIGEPRIMEINASGTGIGGLDPRWRNISVVESDNNGSEIVLTNIIDVDNQETATITLVYANSSGDYFNVNDMTVAVKVGYSSDGGLLEYSDPTDATFDTPITVFQTYTQNRYMRSDSHTINGIGAYRFDTIQSTTAQTLNERDLFSNDVIYYIKVYVRHSTSQWELTSGKTEVFRRASNGEGYQTYNWSCPGYDLDPTDAIMVEVYMDIGSNSYGPITFITEQLNAEELVAGTWTISFYTYRRYQGFQTRGIFYWGDSGHNSRIENFQFKAL
jgi:hypothetical protein